MLLNYNFSLSVRPYCYWERCKECKDTYKQTWEPFRNAWNLRTVFWSGFCKSLLFCTLVKIEWITFSSILINCGEWSSNASYTALKSLDWIYTLYVLDKGGDFMPHTWLWFSFLFSLITIWSQYSSYHVSSYNANSYNNLIAFWILINFTKIASAIICSGLTIVVSHWAIYDLLFIFLKYYVVLSSNKTFFLIS